MTNNVVKKLPISYQRGDEQEEIATALTAGIAAQYELWRYYLDNYEELFLDPATCLPEWLDALARQAGWGEIWDSSWTEQQKRDLLINTSRIWEGRGNIQTLELLFEIFGLEVALSQNDGWILDTTPLPAGLLSIPFSYSLIPPEPYPEGSREDRLLRLLFNYFSPCWGEIIVG